MNAFLVAGDSLCLNLSFSKKIDTTSIDYCDNAEVKLYCNDEFVEIMERIGNGDYASSHIIEGGRAYSCEIEIPGYSTVKASTYIPEKSAVRKVGHFYNVGIIEDGFGYHSVEITFLNDINNLRYYELKVELSNSDDYWNDLELIYVNDPVILNEGLPIPIFSNEIMIDSVQTIRLNYTLYDRISELHLRNMRIAVRSVSYDYYAFKRSTYLYVTKFYGDGVLTPMGNNNLYSNIKNGIGIFCGYSSTEPLVLEPNSESVYE